MVCDDCDDCDDMGWVEGGRGREGAMVAFSMVKCLLCLERAIHSGLVHGKRDSRIGVDMAQGF
jgi:hypothetical protein